MTFKDYIKARILEDMDITVYCYEESMPVRGNVSAMGSNAVDKAAEDEVLAKLQAGDEWAWCSVEVSGTWKGLQFNDHLGCCSYEDEADFKASSYYTNMVDEVAEQIADAVLEIVNKVLE